MKKAIEFNQPTEQLASSIGIKASSIRTRLCKTGSYFGLKPQKLSNGRLLWPSDSVGQLLEEGRGRGMKLVFDFDDIWHRQKRGSLEKTFAHVPPKHLPGYDTFAYALLVLLSDGKPYSTREIMAWLGRDPRSARQCLTNKTHGYWLIHNLRKKGNMGLYQLDDGHLSGDAQDDKKARNQARILLARHSLNQARRESERLPVASERYQNLTLDLDENF